MYETYGEINNVKISDNDNIFKRSSYIYKISPDDEESINEEPFKKGKIGYLFYLFDSSFS